MRSNSELEVLGQYLLVSLTGGAEACVIFWVPIKRASMTPCVVAQKGINACVNDEIDA